MVVVFVVDDDEAVLRVIDLSLRVEGFDVSTFPSGLHALAALAERSHPDAIVLDLNMPEITCLKWTVPSSSDWHDKPATETRS